MLQCELFHRARRQLHAAAGGAVGLGQYGNHIEALREQPLQCRGSKMRSAGEDYFQMALVTEFRGDAS